jgi:hypothetical protein
MGNSSLISLKLMLTVGKNLSPEGFLIKEIYICKRTPHKQF